MSPEDKLKLAKNQLEKVQVAWYSPTDWDDLSLYGFYCLENAVGAATIKAGLQATTRHHEKAQLASQLHQDHGLTDVSDLLRDLNEARKHVAYGDVPDPGLDAEDVAKRIEAYVDEVEAFISK
jgi:hypothetical protein